ncbi:MAG: lysophospholipid acyltransferase family protein [Alphaproteobacteria bacterium]
MQPDAEPTVYISPVLGAARLVAYALWTIALIPVQAAAIALKLPLAWRLPRFYHRVCCRLLGIRLLVHGRRSRKRPTLFVGNHASYLDIMIYGALIEGSFVAKQEVASWPFFGLLAKLQRSIFIDRRIRTSLSQSGAIRQRLEARHNLVLFPEGTSSDGNRVLGFKSALFAAADAEVKGRHITVQPISIAYTELDGLPVGRHLRPFFAWYGNMELASHLWQLVGLGRPTVDVTFHEPVTMDDFGSRKELAAYCHRAVSKGHGESLAGRWRSAAGKAGMRAWLRQRRRRKEAAAGRAA